MTDHPDRPRRPLSDSILLVLATAIGACLFAAVVGVIVVRIVDPSTDVGAPASSLGTLLSALAGYVIGSTRSKNGNGAGH